MLPFVPYHLRRPPIYITKYIKTLAKYIENHNLIQKATQLQQQYYYTPDAANHLNELITKGMLLAESKCSTPYRLPWCKETHEIMTATNILRSYASSLCNHMDLSTSIERKLATLKKPFPSQHHLTKQLQCSECTKLDPANSPKKSKPTNQKHTKNVNKPLWKCTKIPWDTGRHR